MQGRWDAVRLLSLSGMRKGWGCCSWRERSLWRALTLEGRVLQGPVTCNAKGPGPLDCMAVHRDDAIRSNDCNYVFSNGMVSMPCGYSGVLVNDSITFPNQGTCRLEHVIVFVRSLKYHAWNCVLSRATVAVKRNELTSHEVIYKEHVNKPITAVHWGQQVCWTTRSQQGPRYFIHWLNTNWIMPT